MVLLLIIQTQSNPVAAVLASRCKMSLDNKLDDVQAQLRQLNLQQSELQKQKFEANKEELLKLDWLKGEHLWFSDNPWGGAYGQPEYVLRGGKRPQLLRDIWSKSGHGTCHTVFGDSKNYMDNVLVRRPMGDNEFSDYEFYTSNAETFVAFLKKVDVTVHAPSNTKEKVLVYSFVNEIGI